MGKGNTRVQPAVANVAVPDDDEDYYEMHERLIGSVPRNSYERGYKWRDCFDIDQITPHELDLIFDHEVSNGRNRNHRIYLGPGPED